MNIVRPEVKRVISTFEELCGLQVIHNEEGTHRPPRLVAEELRKHFQYSKLLKWLEKFSLLEVERFIDFAIHDMNTRDTHGMYHEVMPYVNAYHNVPEFLGYPLYDRLGDAKIVQLIRPVRIEYLDLYVLQKKVRQHPFLKKFPNWIRPRFQITLDGHSERFFDAGYPELQTLVEINECRNNHDDNPNDELKRSIAKSYGYHLLTFLDPGSTKEAQEQRPKMLAKFAQQVTESLINAILAHKQCSVDYSIHAFEMKCKNICRNLKDRLRESMDGVTGFELALRQAECRSGKERYEVVTRILNAIDVDMVKNIIAIRKTMQGIGRVAIGQVCKILGAFTQEALLLEIVSQGMTEVDFNGTYTIGWEGLVQVILKTNLCDRSIKETVWEYVVALGPIYEEILVRVRQYYDDRCPVRGDIEALIDHNLQKQVARYNVMKEAGDERERKLAKDLKAVSEVEKKLITHGRRIVGSLEKKVSQYNNRKEKETLQDLKSEIETFAAEREARLVPTSWTIGTTPGESLIIEIPDFEVVYDPRTEYAIARIDLLEQLKLVSAPDSFITQLFEWLDGGENHPYLRTRYYNGLYLRNGPKTTEEEIQFWNEKLLAANPAHVPEEGSDSDDSTHIEEDESDTNVSDDDEDEL